MLHRFPMFHRSPVSRKAVHGEHFVHPYGTSKNYSPVKKI
jgi:hypothetical protein